MNILKFTNGQVQDFTIVLTNREKKNIGQLSGVQNVKYTRKLNGYNEMSFSVYKYSLNNDINGLKHTDANEYLNNLWDNIVNFKLIWVKELNEYFEIQVSLDDSDNTIKYITARSLCECELSQIMIYGLEVNTDEDIDRDDYKPTIFYDEYNEKNSLLHRILSFTPHYTIKHVDFSLINIQRTFSVDGTSVYDFLIGEVSEQFNCLFVFDSSERGIYVYDLYTLCLDCGERGDYENTCPKCDSKNIKYFGEDTTIYVDKNNLTESIKLEVDVDSIKNCFKLEAGDDVITAAVRDLNPNGSDKYYVIPDYVKEDMSEELIEKLNSYNELYESKISGYEDLSTEIYELINDIVYYRSSMMPTVETAKVNSDSEAAKLTAANLSPIALSSVTTSTSVSTVNSAVKNYAKVYVKTGYVKLDIQDGSTFRYVGKDSQGNNYGTWNGSFKVTNYSDKEDVVTTKNIEIKIYDNYKEFTEQRIEKNIKSANEDDDNILDLLNPDITVSQFEVEIGKYSLNRVTSFHDAIRGALDVLIEMDQASEGADLYESIYVPYYNKMLLCEERMDELQEQIDGFQKTLNEKNEEKRKIQAELNIQKYLGDLYSAFCSYIREDKYTNSNYISDGLDDSQIIEKTKEFIEVATEELNKASMKKYTISTTLYNLLALKEFEPLVEYFELGNFIRIRADKELYKLRLLEYTIDFDNIQNIDVVFSNATKLGGFMSDIEDIISSAQSITSSFDTVMKQAESGNEAQNSINSWLTDSLNSALFRIKNNNNEEITITRHGLIGKSKDDITGAYSTEQFWLTHNIMAFTDNNWESCKLAMGKHDFKYYDSETDSFPDATAYGLSAQFVLAGYLIGNQIIGGDLYSDNYSSTNKIGTHIDLRKGTFSLGDSFVFDGTTLNIKNVNLDWQTTTNPGIGHIIGLTDELNGLSASININAGKIQTEIERATAAEGVLSSRITQTAESIKLEVNQDLSDLEEELSASIQINANAITSEVTRATNAESSLSSRITQTANSITSEVTRATAEEGRLSSMITQTADSISSKVEKGDVVSEINQSADLISIKSNRIEINSTNFNLSKEGNVTAKNLTLNGGSININNKFIVDINGNVTLPSSAKITWNQVTDGNTNVTTITENTLKTTSVTAENLVVNAAKIKGTLTASQINTTGLIAENISGTTISGKTISGGSITIGNNFSVDINGNVTASSITITGGSVAGSTITSSSLAASKMAQSVWNKVDDIIANTVTANYIFSKDTSTLEMTARSASALNLYVLSGGNTVKYDVGSKLTDHENRLAAIEAYIISATNVTEE